MTTAPDLPSIARVALACLDLTSLNDHDTEADITQLCRRAQGRGGPVAAVCVWPRFATSARRQLPPAIRVAAVVNFPDGSTDLARVVRETQEIVQAGAQEVDVVIPYAALSGGDNQAVSRVLQAVRAACPGLTLKAILETGVLDAEALIELASRVSLDAGADFLKTSTGKTAVSATPAAARTMMQAISGHAAAATRAGFKASGGLRTVQEAGTYIALCAEILGPAALSPVRFRIGASSLLNDIEAVLGVADAAAPGASDRY